MTSASFDLVEGFANGWGVVTAAAGAHPTAADGAASTHTLPLLHDDASDALDVWLRRRFSIAAPAHARLVLPRVGPIAELFLDGKSMGTTRNLFRTHELTLDLAAGEHELAICLRSTTRALAEKRPRPRWKTRLVANQQLRWLRTSLLGRIPSWSPTGAPRGVLAAPQLLRFGSLRPDDVELTARLVGDRGIVRVILPASCRVSGGSLHVGAATTELALHDGRWSAELELQDPPRWWPHTHGAPTCIPAKLVIDGKPIALEPVGFRTVELEDDPRRFGVRINGEPVFCRGAVFVPPPATLDFAPTLRALEALRDAGGNMVRISGTMRYEGHAFFAACDALGLMVWQDFMFANMDYPIDDPAFAAEVTTEVDEQLRSWAGHPSIAVLCGGSEVAQQAAMVGQPVERWYGPLFETLLPTRCRALLPNVPYTVGSPSSPLDGDGAGEPTPLPFRVDRGVAHYYGVGAYLRPFDDARRADVTFASECLGLSNVPEPDQVEALFGDDLAATHTPRWKSGVPRDNGAGWDFEDVRDHYLALLFGQDALLMRYADAEGYLERSRIASAEIMTRVFSEWRRAGSSTRGGLVWTLRDLVRGAGWGLLDVDGREKAALYALRRVWAPTALLLTDEGTNGLRLHVVHDGAGTRTLTLKIALYRRDALVAGTQRAIIASPRSAVAYDVEGLFGGFRDVGWAYRFGPRAHDVLLATLYDGDTLVGEASHMPTLPLHPADAGLTVETVRVDERRYRATIRAEKLALFVAVRVPNWRPSASYFHLGPDETRVIELCARDVHTAAPRGDVHALGSTPARLVGA